MFLGMMYVYPVSCYQQLSMNISSYWIVYSNELFVGKYEKAGNHTFMSSEFT